MASLRETNWRRSSSLSSLAALVATGSTSALAIQSTSLQVRFTNNNQIFDFGDPHFCCRHPQAPPCWVNLLLLLHLWPLWLPGDVWSPSKAHLERKGVLEETLELLWFLAGRTEEQAGVSLWPGHLHLVGGGLGQVSGLQQIAKTLFFYLDISLANPLYRILAGYFPDGEGYNLTSWWL